jgi:hypothetical protein
MGGFGRRKRHEALWLLDEEDVCLSFRRTPVVPVSGLPTHHDENQAPMEKKNGEKYRCS